MYNIDELENLIKSRLSQYRYNHSMCVAKKAKELAKKYGLDEEKAYVAGILHDITKEEKIEVQLLEIQNAGFEMSELELKNLKVYHQKSGAAYVKNHLNITDQDIINGIKFHTTGHENMTLFEMIIYLADFTSDDRDYPDVDIMREETEKSLLLGMLYSLRYTITSIASKNRQIHPDTLYCYNWVLEQIEKEEK